MYLEVALYGEEDPETVKLNKWWRQKRHPQRHNNFLEKGFQVLTNRMSSISKAWDKIENSFINDGEDEATERDEEEGGGGKSAYVPSRGSSSGGRGLRSVVESPGGDSSNSGGGGIGSNSRGNSDNYASGGLTIDGSMTPPESQIYTAANMGQWSSPVRSSEGGGRPLEGRGFASHSPKLRTRSDAEEANSGKIGRISPPYSGSNTGSISPPVVFREGLAEKEDRLRAASAWGHMPGWRMLPCFIKSNDDLRQEQLASQLIREMANVLSSAKVPVWLYPYQNYCHLRQGWHHRGRLGLNIHRFAEEELPWLHILKQLLRRALWASRERLPRGG